MIETIPAVLAELSAFLLVAAIGGHFARRLGQPAVLGELAAGMVLGGAALLLPETPIEALFHAAREEHSHIALLAEIGLVLLLFEVGLETHLDSLLKTGWTAVAVAVIGVFLPFALGVGVSLGRGQGDIAGHLFVGASLAATSVGLTAQVFRELKRVASRPARIVLAAAVLDDVLGLILLAVVSGLAAGSTGSAGLLTIIITTSAKAALFLTAALLIGRKMAPRMFAWMAHLQGHGLLMMTAMAFCFMMAWLADLGGLAPIVGAFVAGLVLDDAHLRPFGERPTRVIDLERQLTPVSELFVPIFFVYVGLQIDLSVLADPNVVALAGLLTVAAVLGKLASGLAVPGSHAEKLAVGLAMVPRGEVGLIFATIGSQLGVLDERLYGAIVLMVVATTVLSPPLLKRVMERIPQEHAA